MIDAANDNGKRCSACLEHKPLRAFSRDKSKRDGHHTKCKACVIEYRGKNAARISAKRKEYRAAHAEEISAYMREYRAQYREKNREMLVQKSIEWARATPEKRKTIARRWRENNPEASRAIVRNRRAKMRLLPGKHTADDIRDIGEMQRWRCACCKTKLVQYHVDHVIPVASGGSNDRSNLQLLCPPCNQSKNARDPVEFMQSRGFLC